MSRFCRREGTPEDNPALQQLFSTPQPSSGVFIAFERSPDYFASAAVMYQDSSLLVVNDDKHNKLAAAVNMGHRQAYINGSPQRMRYGADMRIAPDYRGGRVLFYINRIVKQVIADDWYLTVILKDNRRSTSSLEGGRAGLPHYKPIGDITTFNITAVRTRPAANVNDQIRQAVETDIPAMNAWVNQMRAFYQFLPCYDFQALLTDDPFYAGLDIKDFLLLERDGQLAGLVGLWNQKALKQARVVAYSRLMKVIRPVYNCWSHLIGGLILPPENHCFDYLSLHSPLTQPDDLSGFSQLLHAAWQATRKRDFSCMVLTLSDMDPRLSVLGQFKHIAMHARQYCVSYNEADQPELLSGFIPFHDAGRL